MKKIVWAILISALTFYACGSKSDSNTSDTTSQADDDSNKQALELVRAEPKVKKAFIDDAGVLYASVEDDGTRRDGYASYLCEILREQKAKASHVKVMKIDSTNDSDNTSGVLLGESSCK